MRDAKGTYCNVRTSLTMGLAADLADEVSDIFSSTWSTRNGLIVPENDSLALSNQGVLLEGSVLYADLAESTDMVDSKTPTFSAEVYKSFLRCACKIISSLDGTVTAFDGDRVMGVFIGDACSTRAVKSALRINWAMHHIVNPKLKVVYANSDFVARHGAGVDHSKLLVARTGIRGSNDLVWVGPAANYAAKLSALRVDGNATWISKAVFERLLNEAKFDDKKNLIWQARTWTKYSRTVYCSSHWWQLG